MMSFSDHIGPEEILTSGQLAQRLAATGLTADAARQAISRSNDPALWVSAASSAAARSASPSFALRAGPVGGWSAGRRVGGGCGGAERVLLWARRCQSLAHRHGTSVYGSPSRRHEAGLATFATGC